VEQRRSERPGRRAPQNLNEALDALEADEVICNAIGKELAEEFAPQAYE
jgi:glutamine synthetase